MSIINKIENFGIGVDIESIGRFRKLDPVKNNSFLNKIFTKNELDYCFSKESTAPHLAVRFAAKEAVIKALSSICKVKLHYNEIEIVNNENGAPMVKINNPGLHNLQVHLSLSHCKDKAIAFATAIEGESL